MNALVQTNQDSYRASTDAAGLCRDIVVASATKIQNKSYVTVEGWQAIAIAHGCAASALDVIRVNDEDGPGYKCVGVVRRMSDGAEIARAEGFLGDDEKTWASRAVYAKRAMAQTRAISRACRSAFAHVVVMMKAGLSTTPAEEVPYGGFDNGDVIDHAPPQHPQPEPRQARQKPEPLKGPIKTRAKLREAAGDIVKELEQAVDGGDISYVNAVLDAWAPAIQQIREEGPTDWWNAPEWGLNAKIEWALDAVKVPAE